MGRAIFDALKWQSSVLFFHTGSLLEKFDVRDTAGHLKSVV
jgi:hypothetical protein